jgi:hypothetical protein
LNSHLFENLPYPLFAKEGHYSSLWQREVRRAFYKKEVMQDKINRLKAEG